MYIDSFCESLLKFGLFNKCHRLDGLCHRQFACRGPQSGPSTDRCSASLASPLLSACSGRPRTASRNSLLSCRSTCAAFVLRGDHGEAHPPASSFIVFRAGTSFRKVGCLSSGFHFNS